MASTISTVIVDYLVERLKKVSPEITSVVVVPFVLGGQRFVPGAEEFSPGRRSRYLPLARHRDLGVLHDKLEEGQATRGWLGRRRNPFLNPLVYLAYVFYRKPRRYLASASQNFLLPRSPNSCSCSPSLIRSSPSCPGYYLATSFIRVDASLYLCT